MTSLRSIIVAALCALSSVSHSHAQIAVKTVPIGGAGAKAPPPIERKIDPKAKEIYDRALAERRKLATIQFDAQMRLEGVDEAGMFGMPDEMRAKSRYQIRFVESAADAKPTRVPPHSMRVETLDGSHAGRVTIVHGGKALQVDAKAKTFVEGKDGIEMLVGIASVSCPEWFRASSPAAAGGEPIVLELAGTATVDDLECDVVKVVREIEFGVVEGMDEADVRMTKVPVTETIAFARADGLPRRIGMAPPAMGGDDEGMPAMPTPVVTVFGLKANPKLEDSAFALDRPEGYREVEFEMPGFPGGDAGGEGAMPAPPALAVKVGDPAPEFKLMALDGKEVTLASLKGKVVLLDFWATWCGPCKAAMPTIQKLSEEYKGKEVVVLGVNTWEQKKDAAKDYMASKKFTYGCLLMGDDLAKAYGISGIPTLVIIGKDGTISEIEVGLADPSGAGLRKAIDAALKK